MKKTAMTLKRCKRKSKTMSSSNKKRITQMAVLKVKVRSKRSLRNMQRRGLKSSRQSLCTRKVGT